MAVSGMSTKDASTLSGQKNNAEFWKEKIEKNAARDERDYELLERAGWHVIVVWECELRKNKREESLRKLLAELKSVRDV